MRGVRSTRAVVFAAGVTLWIALLVVGFVAQVTKLFGTHSDGVTLALLGVGSVGFILIACAGYWLVMHGFDDRSR